MLGSIVSEAVGTIMKTETTLVMLRIGPMKR